MDAATVGQVGSLSGSWGLEVRAIAVAGSQAPKEIEPLSAQPSHPAHDDRSSVNGQGRACALARVRRSFTSNHARPTPARLPRS